MGMFHEYSSNIYLRPLGSLDSFVYYLFVEKAIQKSFTLL